MKELIRAISADKLASECCRSVNHIFIDLAAIKARAYKIFKRLAPSKYIHMMERKKPFLSFLLGNLKYFSPLPCYNENIISAFKATHSVVSRRLLS